MIGLEISLTTVTPTFCRGSGWDTPELRAPSLKGLLRWWYRAWHPWAVRGPLDGPWAEGRVMGATQAFAGQSPFLLGVQAEPAPKPIAWNEIERTADRGSRDRVGGQRYLGFSFRNSDKEHWAISAATSFQALHRFRRPPGDEAARALVASWWLLAHLGGLGARSRRGFGSLSLEDWSWPGHDDLLKQLPLPSQAADVQAWTDAMRRGLETLESWLEDRVDWPDNYPHPHLGPRTRVVMDDRTWRRPEQALEEAGRILALGRRDHRGPFGPVDGRVTLGLPLTTGRGRNERKWRPGSWRGERVETDVHASPLHLHVARFRGGFGLCWSRLDGAVPGLGGYRVREEHSRETIRAPAPDTLDGFMDNLDGARWTPGGRT